MNQHGRRGESCHFFKFKGRKKSSRIFMQDVVRCLFLYENNEQQKVCALGGEHKVLIKNTTRKKEDIDLLLIQKMIFCILLR